MQLKYCRQCEKNMPLERFNKSKKTKDGYQSPCKYCISDKRKSHAPVVDQNLELLSIAKKILDDLRPSVTVNCDFEDYTKTKMWHNKDFVADDGGYQEYINKINIARG